MVPSIRTHSSKSRVHIKGTQHKMGNTRRRKYKENKGIEIELKEYMKAEIESGRIQVKQNEQGETIWECGYCSERYEREKGATTHIGKCTQKQEKEDYNVPTAQKHFATQQI